MLIHNMRVEQEVRVSGSLQSVWDIVSDIDSEPKYWKGTKSIRNITRDGNNIHREIIIAFRDQKCVQEVTIHPQSSIEFRFVQGIISGTKNVLLSEREGSVVIRVIWDIKLSGVMGMFGGIISGHIKKGTLQALKSIKREVECL